MFLCKLLHHYPHHIFRVCPLFNLLYWQTSSQSSSTSNAALLFDGFSLLAAISKQDSVSKRFNKRTFYCIYKFLPYLKRQVSFAVSSMVPSSIQYSGKICFIDECQFIFVTKIIYLLGIAANTY